MPTHPERVPVGRTTSPALRRYDATVFAKHLDMDEKLIQVIHRHPLALIRVLLVPGIGMLVGIGLGILFFGNLLFLVLAIIIFLASAGFFVYQVFDWYYDVYLLTSESLLLLFWDSPLNVQSKRIRYDSIETVEVRKSGLLDAMLNMGTVTIASPSGMYPLTSVYRPDDIQEQITETVQRKKEELQGAAAAAPEPAPGHDGAAEIEVLKEAVQHLVDEAKDASEERRSGSDRRES